MSAFKAAWIPPGSPSMSRRWKPFLQKKPPFKSWEKLSGLDVTFHTIRFTSVNQDYQLHLHDRLQEEMSEQGLQLLVQP